MAGTMTARSECFLARAMGANKRQRETLMKRSKEDQTGLGEGLGPVGGLPMRVRMAEAGLLGAVSHECRAKGTAMRESGGYVIFLDADAVSQPACGGMSDPRFLVYHEYAHILHGDVFEDKDDCEKVRLMSLTPEELRRYWQPAERAANEYAAARLRSEVETTAQAKHLA